MIKPEPPKPPPMREIRDDGSSALAFVALLAFPSALLILGFIKAFGL